MAHPLLQAVRQNYKFRCGYCGVSEVDVGGELTVDHFQPIAAGGTDDEENLVYACVRCNQYKGALITEVTQSPEKPRILHPLRDEVYLHLQEDESTGVLIGITPSGRFHIEALRLNRSALVINRNRRRLLTLLEISLEQAKAENRALDDRLACQEIYISYLEARLDA